MYSFVWRKEERKERSSSIIINIIIMICIAYTHKHTLYKYIYTLSIKREYYVNFLSLFSLRFLRLSLITHCIYYYNFYYLLYMCCFFLFRLFSLLLSSLSLPVFESNQNSLTEYKYTNECIYN